MISARFKEELVEILWLIDGVCWIDPQIPEKYNNVPLNSATLAQQVNFRNPEIIDNIHFKSMTA